MQAFMSLLVWCILKMSQFQSIGDFLKKSILLRCKIIQNTYLEIHKYFSKGRARAFSIRIKMLFRMSASQNRVSWVKSQFWLWFQLPANAFLGRQQLAVQLLGSLPLMWETCFRDLLWVIDPCPCSDSTLPLLAVEGWYRSCLFLCFTVSKNKWISKSVPMICARICV